MHADEIGPTLTLTSLLRAADAADVASVRRAEGEAGAGALVEMRMKGIAQV